MDADRVVREQLLSLLRGGNAHMTFDQAVADFPMERINSLPPNVTYTPWHILEHIRIAQWDILEFTRDPDHVSPRWPEGYWPPPDEPADEFKWEKTIGDFRADLRALQDMVEDSGTDLSDRQWIPGALSAVASRPGVTLGRRRYVGLSDTSRIGKPEKQPLIPIPGN